MRLVHILIHTVLNETKATYNCWFLLRQKHEEAIGNFFKKHITHRQKVARCWFTRTQFHRHWKQRKHARILQFPALVNKPNESPLHSRTTTVTTSWYSARHRICIKTNFSSEQTVRIWTFKTDLKFAQLIISQFYFLFKKGKIAINNPRLEAIIRYFVFYSVDNSRCDRFSMMASATIEDWNDP